jgi:hypothetical protein
LTYDDYTDTINAECRGCAGKDLSGGLTVKDTKLYPPDPLEFLTIAKALPLIELSDRQFRYLRRFGLFAEPDLYHGKSPIWFRRTVDRWREYEAKNAFRKLPRMKEKARQDAVATRVTP